MPAVGCEGYCRVLLVAVLVFPRPLAADPVLLEYQVSGLSGAVLENTLAYLGPPPDTEDERDNFVYSAEGQVRNSLIALGYYRPRIELQLAREQAVWQLAIAVEPGERVRIREVDLRVDGAAGSDASFEALIDSNPIRPGEGLHHGQYEDFKLDLQSLGDARGYFDARLTHSQVSVDVDSAEALVELHYASGERYRFGRVAFDGFPLDRQRLEQLQTFVPGDLYDISVLQAFQADLQSTGYFGRALVRTEVPDPESREVPVQVDLQPGDRHHFRVGLGYSTDTEGRISFGWRTPLVNARGHSQDSRVEYSPVRPRLRFSYAIPLSHPLRDTLRLGARLESNEYGDLDSWQREVSARREYKFRQDWVVSGGVRYLLEDWDVGADSLSNQYLLARATLAHTHRSGDTLDPRAGFSQLYAVESGLDQAGSDIDLLRLYAHLRGVYTLAPDHRVVGRMELGAVYFDGDNRPDLAPSLSFFAGGSQSLRGYAYQSLGPSVEVETPGGGTTSLVVGGDRLAILSAEYQYYVTPSWRAALFIDAGNAFNAGDFDPVVGAGIGVHFVSPVGAVRVDFGNSVSENSSTWRVHLNLGAEF